MGCPCDYILEPSFSFNWLLILYQPMNLLFCYLLHHISITSPTPPVQPNLEPQICPSLSSKYGTSTPASADTGELYEPYLFMSLFMLVGDLYYYYLASNTTPASTSTPVVVIIRIGPFGPEFSFTDFLFVCCSQI